MLDITFKSGNKIEWRVGEELPYSYPQLDDIIYIEASGTEFLHIQKLFCPNIQSRFVDRRYSIPMPSDKAVVVWFGDIAKTIVANL